MPLTLFQDTGAWQQAESSPVHLASVPIETSEEPSFGARKAKVAEQAKAATAPPPGPTAEQLAEMREVFDAVDKDKNGRLDRSEIADVGLKLGRYLTATDLAAGMSEMDMDGDGTVDFAEFQVWWWRTGRLNASEQLEAKWAAFTNRFDAVTAAALSGL